MSLTAINLAKIVHWIPRKDENENQDVVFSMSDIKKQYYNELLINRFISMFGINPKLNPTCSLNVKKQLFLVKKRLVF